ncbi:MAG: hypothetical protein O3B95_10865 [Chloroflexi bacterium]|nr:hypothetical protein [Chloroflexota bacterium]
MASCTGSFTLRQVPMGVSPDPTAAPIPITLSRDELAHDSRLEWWYHSGHLESESGREFGFHFVVFKADDGVGEPNLVAQLGVLDVQTGEHFEWSRAQAGLADQQGMPASIQIADWSYGIGPDPGMHLFSTKSGDVEMALTFSAESPPMLHNEIGWIPAELGATYYYSWPRQRAEGQLTLNGEKFAVNGQAWFDHQWGDFFVLGKPAGWQWFALQLGDSGSLMITESRGIDGEIADTYGTYMSPEGVVTSLDGETDGIRLAVIGEWTSATTGATYPSGWSLEIGSLKMDLILNPVVDDQEVKGGLPAVSTYWEGKTRVRGSRGGKPLTGDAYVELSGYVDPEPIEWLYR